MAARQASANTHAGGRQRWRSGARRALPYVVVGSAGFVMAYLVVLFVIFPTRVIPDDTKVPNVVGLSFDDAVTELRRTGFDAAKGEARLNAQLPAETVVQQTPATGSMEPKGTRVLLDVSRDQR
jgi:serine/threonine-protein kinase